MDMRFSEMLQVGGKSNSLGRVDEVLKQILQDRSRLDELYECLFNEDAWVRMRAADALEKVCREHPEWLLPYLDRLMSDVADSSQPSVQWHLAQIYGQVDLTAQQRTLAMQWLKHLISNVDVDWIVAANAMTTLAQFTKAGSFPKSEMLLLLDIQKRHKSNAVIRRANKLLAELSAR